MTTKTPATATTATRTAPTTDTAAATGAADEPTRELLMLDPATLLLDGNVRGTVKLDKDFLASVAAHGVLVPIVAVATSEPGRYRVRYGQRRTLAAMQAGREVPVMVVGVEGDTDAEQIERIVTQVHENEQRAELSTSDKTAAFTQLAAFGLSAAEISQQTRASKTDVAHAVAVSGSKLASKAAQRYEFLTLEQAAAVAEFQDAPDTVKALISAAKTSPGQFEHLAQRARDDRDHAQTRAAAEKALTDAGVTVVAMPGYSDPAKSLSELTTADGTPLATATHKTCPGHAAALARSYGAEEPRTVYVCTDWRTHGHRDRYATNSRTPAASMTTAEREKASAERRRVIENNKAWKSAQTVRRSWLASFLTRKTAPKGAAGFLAAELAHASHELGQALEYNGNALMLELLGIKDKPVLIKAAAASDARAQVLSLAFVLAAYEARTGTHTWRRRDADVGRYFAFLAANGYELSEVEQLTQPKPAKSPKTGPAKTTASTGPAKTGPAGSSTSPEAEPVESVAADAA